MFSKLMKTNGSTKLQALEDEAAKSISSSSQGSKMKQFIKHQRGEQGKNSHKQSKRYLLSPFHVLFAPCTTARPISPLYSFPDVTVALSLSFLTMHATALFLSSRLHNSRFFSSLLHDTYWLL